MFWNRNRHPILETWARLNRPLSRVTYHHHEAFFRALVDSVLHVPAVEPARPPGAVREPVRDEDVEQLEIAHEAGRIAAVCLDDETVAREFPDSTGSFEMSGADTCRMVRDGDYVAMAIFGPRRGESELAVDWGVIEWLGVGLLPWMHRLRGTRGALLRPELIDACRYAIGDGAGLEIAELYLGAGLDGGSRPFVSLRPQPELSPTEWFAFRRSVETALAGRGHDVPVLHEPFDVWVTAETPEPELLPLAWSVDLLYPGSEDDLED